MSISDLIFLRVTNGVHDTYAKRHTALQTLFVYNLHSHTIANILSDIFAERAVYWSSNSTGWSPLWMNWCGMLPWPSLPGHAILVMTVTSLSMCAPLTTHKHKHLLAAPSFVSTFLDRPTKWAFALSISYNDYKFLFDFFFHIDIAEAWLLTVKYCLP